MGTRRAALSTAMNARDRDFITKYLNRLSTSFFVRVKADTTLSAVMPPAGGRYGFAYRLKRWIVHGGRSAPSAVSVIFTTLARTGANGMRVAVPVPLPSAT